jgi:hypothetical protein
MSETAGFIAWRDVPLPLGPSPVSRKQSPKWPRIAVGIPAGYADQVVRGDRIAIWPGFLSELGRLGYVEDASHVVEQTSN